MPVSLPVTPSTAPSSTEATVACQNRISTGPCPAEVAILIIGALRPQAAPITSSAP